MFRHALAYAQARSHPFLSPTPLSPTGPCHALPRIITHIIKAKHTHKNYSSTSLRYNTNSSLHSSHPTPSLYKLPSSTPNQHNGRYHLRRVRNGITKPSSMPRTTTNTPPASSAIEIDMNVIQLCTPTFILSDLQLASAHPSPDIHVPEYSFFHNLIPLSPDLEMHALIV
ncbi:hypothetical protein GQ44DRAFT_435769 [Phaeosphaeriaceae sp. PMI808]|nr:hypothetical protein GQ44DRAFT_435769 [Phaeosphaeriaceae sp. PMI808]